MKSEARHLKCRSGVACISLLLVATMSLMVSSPGIAGTLSIEAISGTDGNGNVLVAPGSPTAVVLEVKVTPEPPRRVPGSAPTAVPGTVEGWVFGIEVTTGLQVGLTIDQAAFTTGALVNPYGPPQLSTGQVSNINQLLPHGTGASGAQVAATLNLSGPSHI